MSELNSIKDKERVIAEKWKKAYAGLGFWMIMTGILIVVFIVVAMLGYF